MAHKASDLRKLVYISFLASFCCLGFHFYREMNRTWTTSEYFLSFIVFACLGSGFEILQQELEKFKRAVFPEQYLVVEAPVEQPPADPPPV